MQLPCRRLALAGQRVGKLPIAFDLYLPKEWAADAARRGKAGVPEEIKFRTKPEIALVRLKLP